jgi:hypothetical protein
VRVRDTKAIRSVQKVQNELTKFECIDIFPNYLLHITVKELAFLVDKKKEKDEISRDTLDALILNL